MDHLRRWISAGLVLSCALAGLVPAAQAKVSAWKDAQGASFKGEPTEVLGPFVVFRVGSGGRRVPMRTFSKEECVRIHAEIAARPPRADTFAEAKGYATRELVGEVSRLENRELVPATLTGQPEPALLLVLSGSHNSSDGWFMASNLGGFYPRIQRVYPGLMEGVFLGARHDAVQHRNIALSAWMPWLVADLRGQESMPILRGFIAKAEGTNVALVTRHGVPLAAGSAGDVESVRVLADRISEVLWQIDPTNPAGWRDRLHYLNATRPADFATGETGPLLVGDPLRPDVLRNYGIKRVEARLAVAEDGKIVPEILSGPADLPAELVEPMKTVLAQAMVAPAIRQGRPVAGTLDYLLEVPPADPQRQAEHAWFGSTSYPVLPIPEWFVLRPIKVSEKDFESSIIGEKADGTVILNAFEVNSGKISRAAQMSAFNSDFFTAGGADSVRPKAGDRQKIDDETTLTWEKVRSEDGFVNMQTGVPKDYTVGYAWAEFEVPKDTDAWLGLGSDDGVKLWLNGASVHDKWIRRQSRVDDDVVPLRLKAGKNRILIKIQNATIDWSFVYRLRLKP